MSEYVACLPDDLSFYDKPLPYLRLAHPRTGEPSLYLPYTPASEASSSSQPTVILQVCKLAPNRGRTWFIGDDLIQDGSILLHTPTDAFFLALPCMLALLNPAATSHTDLKMYAETTVPFQPLSDLIAQAASHPALNLGAPFQPIADPKGKKPQTVAAPARSRHNPDVETLLGLPSVGKVFQLLCERKVVGSNLPSPPPEGGSHEAADEQVTSTTYYRPSTRAVVRILQAKVAHLADPLQTARFETLKRQLARDGLTETSDETLLAQARILMTCEQMAQYLPTSVAAALQASYDFTLISAHHATAAAAQAQAAQALIAATSSKKTPSAAVAAAAKKQAAKGSRAVEALKKVDTRSMMKMTSFFKKKEVTPGLGPVMATVETGTGKVTAEGQTS